VKNCTGFTLAANSACQLSAQSLGVANDVPLQSVALVFNAAPRHLTHLDTLRKPAVPSDASSVMSCDPVGTCSATSVAGDLLTAEQGTEGWQWRQDIAVAQQQVA